MPRDVDALRFVDEPDASLRLAVRTPPSATCRVLTYNVHSCIGADRKYDPHRILDIVRRIDADIVALQEVRAYSAVDDQFHLFQEHLKPMKAVFGTTFRRTRFKFGNALFVRGTDSRDKAARPQRRAIRGTRRH